MGSFIYTNKNILNSNISEIYEDASVVTNLAGEFDVQNQSDNRYIVMLWDRFSSGIGVIYRDFIILLIALYFLRLTAFRVFEKIVAIIFTVIGKILYCFYRIFCCCCVKSEAQREQDEMLKKKLLEAEGLDIFSEDILLDFRMGPLSDKFAKSKTELDEYREKMWVQNIE